jgi:hypothetical protein
MAINTGKVITGGLVAGFVMNVLDMTWNFTVLAADMKAMADQLRLDPAVLTDVSYAIPWIVVDFVIGLVIVWNYAAMRPRLGPGPRTAILAGLVPYVAVTAVLCGFASIGVFTEAMVIRGSVFALISVVAGSLAGAWVYKE